MDFEKLNINKCLNEDCDQSFNQENIKLAVWLYGVILLTQEEEYKSVDVFGFVMEEKKPEDKIATGYIGITCPKCLNTNIYKSTAEQVKGLRDLLLSWLEIVQENQDRSEKENTITIPSTFKYYSPFVLNREGLDHFEIKEYGFDCPEEDEDYFPDDLTIYIAGEEIDAHKQFCSYIRHSNDVPAGIYTSILWFSENDVHKLLKFEKENGVRIFPRYHYHTELVRKIDSLLKYNYYSGKQIDQAKIDHEKLSKKFAQERLEKIKEYAQENNIYGEIQFNQDSGQKTVVEEKQKDLARDPTMTGNFLEILISAPSPIKSPYGQTPDCCDYLWAKTDPFHNEDLPEKFVSEIESDEIKNKAKKIKERHLKMVDLVQENYTKQYVQEFLKDNLVDFLEQYEEHIQANESSYAHIWRLKESYLEGLRKATLNGLSEVAPYVMKREMDAWKIIFNNIKTEKLLIGTGFAYIYYLLCNENEYYYHADLIFEGGNVVIQPDHNNVEHDDPKPESKPEPMISKEDLQELFRNIKTKKKELSAAKELKKHNKVAALEDELEGLKKYRSQVYNPKTKGPRYFKNENNKKAVDSVGNAIKRALTSLAKKHPEAHQHIFKALDGKHLYRETLSYRPAPEEKVDWIFA